MPMIIAVLTEDIRIYGPNPTGRLVKYSGSVLAGVMDINDGGKPIKVNMIQDRRFPESNINNYLSKSDLLQTGKPDGMVNPTDCGIKIGSIE